MSRSVVLAALLAGCYWDPSLTPRDATGDDAPDAPTCTPSQPRTEGITTSFQGSDPVIRMLGEPATTIRFNDPGAGYPMPVGMSANGVEFIAPSPLGCTIEDRVGLAVYPVYMVSATTPAREGTTHTLDITGGGAHRIARVDWTYVHGSECTNGVIPEGRGDTTFHFYPDGRIVRIDNMRPAQATFSPAETCTCPAVSSAMQFIVTTYIGLNADELVNTFTKSGDATEGASGMFPTSFGDDSQDGVAGACVVASGSAARFALRWQGMDPAVVNATRVRRGPIPAGVYELALVRDWIRNAGTLEAATDLGQRTTMYLEGPDTGRDCAAILATLEQLEDSDALGVDGTPVPLDAVGVFDDAASTAREHTGPVTLSVAEGDSIPRGFVVRLRFAGFASIATDRDPARVIWQRNDDGTFEVFFGEELTSDTPVTITPECPT